MNTMEVYALCKKYAKTYCDTHASTLTEEQAVQAVANYFNENPNAIVTNAELESILANYLTEHQDISGKVDKPIEPVAGQGVNVPYYFDVIYDADKATVKDYTVDLLNKDKEPGVYSIDISAATTEKAGLMSAADKVTLSGKQDTIADLADIRSGAAAGATALQSHQDISGKLDILPTVSDPDDPGYGFPYWIPYNFGLNNDADKIEIVLHALTLDNQLLKMDFTNSFPIATTEQAGAMTAADKVKLNNALTEHQSLTAYRTSSDQDTIDATKQDNLIASDNIVIAADGKTISAINTRYTVTVDI